MNNEVDLALLLTRNVGKMARIINQLIKPCDYKKAYTIPLFRPVLEWILDPFDIFELDIVYQQYMEIASKAEPASSWLL